AAQLDRQIRDAAPRVELVRRDDRAGRADLETRGAGAAMRARRRIDRQRQIREDLAEEEIGARVAGDEIRVLTDPAETGVARERFLEHGRAVGEDTVAERTDVRLDRAGELLQALPHHLVVVAAERIA